MATKDDPTIDEKDRRIIELLQEDSSQSIAKIARTKGVNLSAPSVHERIKKMKESGIIKKYTVILEAKKLGKDVTAFIGITLDYDDMKEADVKFANIKDVLEVHHLAGEEDYLLKVKTESISTLEEIVKTINRRSGVRRTRTMIVLSTAKEDTTLSIS